MKNSELNNALSSCHVMIEEMLESNDNSMRYSSETEQIARSASQLFDYYHSPTMNDANLTIDYAGRYYTLNRSFINGAAIISVSRTVII